MMREKDLENKEKTSTDCSKCKGKMYVDYNKYVDSTVWVCRSCGNEILICGNNN